MLEMAVFLERHRTNAQPACQLALHPPSGIHAHPEGANLGSMGMCSGRQGATPEAGPQAQHPPPARFALASLAQGRQLPHHQDAQQPVSRPMWEEQGPSQQWH